MDAIIKMKNKEFLINEEFLIRNSFYGLEFLIRNSLF